MSNLFGLNSLNNFLVPASITFFYICISIKREYKILRCTFIVCYLCFIIFPLISEFLFIPDRFKESKLFDNYYVSPNEALITFKKEHKKNLILVFLESMEISFSSREYGGICHENNIPLLTKISEKYDTNFSSHLNGAFSLPGTTWTTAGQTAILAGIPIKVPWFKNPFKKNFFTNLTTLIDILEDNGYLVESFMGSEKKFGARDKLFERGSSKLYDISSIGGLNVSTNGFIKYKEDKILFNFVKKKFVKINRKEPFAFFIQTIEPHTYFSPVSKKNLREYTKLVKKSDKFIFDFIQWLKKHNFFKDTLVVLVGDHPTMDPSFSYFVSNNYRRKVYVAFIDQNISGSSINHIEVDKRKKRGYSQFDLFPTIISAMGGKITGDRLGLGVNLFSDTPTLVEIMGPDILSAELRKHSTAYEEFFYK